MGWHARLAIAGALALAAPAQGYDKDRGDLLAAHARLQQRDRQLLDMGWKLARANAPFCAGAKPRIGLLLQDLAGYGKKGPSLRHALGLPGDIAVEAVAQDSPAARAGLAPNTPVVALGSTRVEELQNPPDAAWKRLAGLHDLVDSELAASGTVMIGWLGQSGETATSVIAGVPACPGRFEVLDSGTKAQAEGARVIFGRDFPGFDYPQDEFAAAVAHELAHNLLGHRAWLERHGRRQANIRLTEREADRLMPWLLANAGYEPEAASRFMARWGPAHGGGLLRKRTHDGWDERADLIEAELPLIAGVRDAQGRADWSRHFVRETGD